MNDNNTKDAQVLRPSVAHKNLSTEVTAEARHRHTQLPDISKYYIGSSKQQESQKMKSQKKRVND